MVFDMGVKLGLTPKAKKKDYERSKQDHEQGIVSGP
jgi:phage terminase small subunit